MRYSMTVLYAVAIGLCITAPTLGQVINEDLKLLASDGAEGDRIGWSIAIASGIVAVGAPWDKDNGDASGSVYLFDAITGTQIVKLLPSDGAANDYFGYSIAINSGIVAVGAYGDADNGGDSGSAYLFNASTGALIAKLVPDDGDKGDKFGFSIAIDNDVVAVGSPWDWDNGSGSGSAYLFDASSGEQIDKLRPNDGSDRMSFGHSISIDQGIVAVGAPYADDNIPWSGSAYLFDASTGKQLDKLLPRDRSEEVLFGWSIAIDNGIVAVGAEWDDDNGNFSGSAYLFDAANGGQIAKLLPDDGADADLFGSAIAVDNGVVCIGAYFDNDNGDDSGSAYLFDSSTGDQIAKLLPSDGGVGDWFGFSIAMDNSIIALGAPKDVDNGGDAGSAYLFNVGSDGSCLELTVENLVAGERAIFALSSGTPGAKAATVYGTKPGEVSVNNYAGYCATFGIAGVKQERVIGGLNRTFDSNGEITFGLNVPGNLSGQQVLFQSAQHGTCPDECMSTLVEMVVE